MIGWLLDLIPTWAFVLGGAVLLLVVWRLFGLRALIAAGAALAGMLAYRTGRKAGADDALAGVKKTNEKAVKDHDDIEAETDRLPDDQLDADNAPWVRKRR